MTLPTLEYRRTAIRKPARLLQGMDAWVHDIAGAMAGRGKEGAFLARARHIDSMADHFGNLSDGALRARLLEIRNGVRRHPGATRREAALLAEAFAAVREASARTLRLRPYVVQIAGALALHEGYMAEMATGEGKTLSAAMAAIVHGWTGLPCHVITVNDYLAERDATWMGPLYEFCSVTVGHVTSEMDHTARREEYRCDVTYVTNKEIIADFLRDRLWLGEFQKASRRQVYRLLGHDSDLQIGLVMRGIHFAVVDEADSILIDEAVTPLIISRATPNAPFVEACHVADQIAATLRAGVDYRVQSKYREVDFDQIMEDRLVRKIEDLHPAFGGVDGYMELVRQALTAREFFLRDQQYVVEDGRIVIVDEFTGRQMPGRSWRGGLHQFVQTKEGVNVTPPTETLARLSFQRFYRFFDTLSGMSGTAREAAAELWDIYQLAVVSIPRNRPLRRTRWRTRIFSSRAAKIEAIVKEVCAVHAARRPVLIGTRSVQASETLADRLSKERLPFRILNAVRHREEAHIVSMAGEASAVTIATNMAGRGTDIKPGRGIAELGGLHVIATECHESKRIDRQLFGRCARQGDPGSARLFVSTEDEIVTRYVPAVIRGFAGFCLRAAVPGSWLLGLFVIAWAQGTAGRIAHRRRRTVLRTDTWLEDSLSFAHQDVT